MSELLERTIGSAGAVGAFGLFFVWIADFQIHYKLLATGVAAFVIMVIAGMLIFKRRRLHQKRQEQLRLHRAEDGNLLQVPENRHR